MTTAVVLAFGGVTTGALAQEEPETPPSTTVEQTPTSTTSTPQSTSDLPPPATEPAPPSGTESSAPATTSESAMPPSAPEDQPSGDESAAVGGAYKIYAAEDRNGNGSIDKGEEIGGLVLRFVDKNTGGVVAERTTGSTGGAEFTGLPVGAYWLKVTGAWTFSNGLSVQEVFVNDREVNHQVFLKPGSVAPDVRGSVRFEKTSYESHEAVRIWLTLTNVAEVPAEGVKLEWLSGLELPRGEWGDFYRDGAGIRLDAGQSRTFEATGRITGIRDGKIDLSGILNYAGRPAQHVSYFFASVPVVQTKGDISGVVYLDKNRNGRQDAGEAAEGAVVEANGGVPYGYLKTTTDSEGRFSFKDAPSGEYYVGYTLAGGWIVHTDDSGTTIRVQPGAPVELVARGERPYTETLSATLTLDKDVYQVGEVAKISITLTNSGDQEITNVMAWCNRVGDGNQLGGGPDGNSVEGWGELVWPGKGVTVGAGETRTIVATQAVPQAAQLYGRVIASCGFAPYAGWNTDAAETYDSARVPGAFGSIAGELYHDRNGDWRIDPGETIGDTRIVLRDRELGVDVAETVTDAEGNLRFDRVPAGDYWAWVDGPWQFEGEYGGHVGVIGGVEGRYSFTVVPGPAPEHDGGSTPPAAAPAAGAGAGGSGADALAKTGASVLGLGLLGALLVAFGLGASVIGRKRQVA